MVQWHATDATGVLSSGLALAIAAYLEANPPAAEVDPAEIEAAVEDYLTANPPTGAPDASETVKGIVELATNAEATTGTDTARAVTPANVKAALDNRASDFATAAQGSLADSATQPGDLATVAMTGDYDDLTGKPTIPDSADDIGAAPATQAINAQTGAYTLVSSDAGKLVTLTLTAAADLTVPADVFTAGQRVDIADRGTARATVLAGSGMTVNPPPGGSLVMEGQYAYASLVFLSATEADLVGLVAAS